MDRRGFIGLAAGSTLAACAPRRAGESGAAGVLNASIGLPEPHAMFAPGGGGSGPSFTGSKVLERLVRLNEDQSFGPVLATAWSAREDGRRIDVTLRSGVQWHDGRPLTVEDVIWSATEYWRPFAPETAFDVLERVEQSGDQQIAFHFREPVPEASFLYVLAFGPYYVLPRHLYAGADLLLNPVNNAPVGTGPWRFSKWVRGSHVEFTKNPSYWIPDRPRADKLIIRWFREPASRVAALETGAVDIAVQSPAALNDLTRLKSNPGLVIEFEDDAAGGGALYFNTRKAPFDDVRVRQALLHAVDRDYIARTVYAGYGKPATGPIYSNNRQYFTPDVPTYAFDPARAEALLDAAGHKRGVDGKRLTINLLASGWYEENGKVGAYLKQALGAVGVEAKLRVPDRANSLKALYTDYDFDLAYSQGGGVSTEPLPTLALVYGTRGIRKGLNFRNASRFSDPETDRLITAIAAELDADRRRALVQALNRRLIEQAPAAPLVEIRPHLIRSRNIRIGDVGSSITVDSWGDIGPA